MWRLAHRLVAVFVAIIACHGASAQENLPPTVGQRSDGPHWVGVNSCAATACHGGRAGRVGGEYTTWITRDPHARAYSVLFNERSLRMAENLAGPGKPVKVPPHQDAACLNCHAPSGGNHKAGVYLGDGVGCESCHGAAGAWLAEHAKIDWQPFSDARQRQLRSKLGINDTGDVLVRARQCVGCHVGGTDRDVNHDLIAAGHPRLNFELTTYYRTLPAHWDRQAERRDDPGHLARSWLVGQAAAAAAAMELLKQRAGEKQSWPEFAEYDCFSCHHDLASPSWRQRRGYTGKPGALDWGDWYLPLSRSVSAAGDRAELEPFARLTPAFIQDPAEFDRLRGLMAHGRPDREQVQRQAGAAAEQLAVWSVKLNDPRLYPPEVTSSLLSTVAEDPLNLAETSWDASAQLYLALVALHRATLDGRGGDTRTDRDQEIVTVLRAMRDDLRYPETKGNQAYRYESPRGFSPERFRANLASLQQALASP